MPKDNNQKSNLSNIAPNASANKADKKTFGWESMKKNIDTMQDDIAGLISEKNHQKGKAAVKSNNFLKDMQRNLAEVYTDGNGKIPDLTKLDKNQRPLWKTILYSLIAIFAVLFVVALGSFVVFSNLNQETFTNEHVVFKIEPPISLVSGDVGTYNIIITNNEKVNLYDLRVELFYPENFQLINENGQVSSDTRNTLDLSVLKIGETQKFEFKGKIIAPLNSLQTFKGILKFKPANINAEFKQEQIVDANIASSVISLDIAGPEKALADENVEYVISYKNLGSENLTDLQIVADLPKNFIVASATPEALDGTNNVWSIAKLASSTSASTTASSTASKIIIRGNYSAVAESGNQEIKARIDIKHGGDWYPQNEDSAITNIIKDQLTMQMIINGSGEDQPISFGDLLVYTINYKNSGQEELKNIKLIANLNSNILNWDSLQDDNKGKKADSQIVWTGQEIPQLLSLRPGEEGSLSFQIRVKELSAIEDLAAIDKFSVESFAEAQIPDLESTGGNPDIKSKSITNSVNSDLGLNAQARYYDPDNIALGSGPIQPKLGETSSYNIQMQLMNNLHDVADIEVSFTLPKYVTWDDKKTINAGDLIYNSKTRQVQWKISKLPKTAKNTNIDFNISIKPIDSDLGRVLILIPQIDLVAKDAETGADIKKSIKAITTAFNDPILGELDGIVQ